MIICRNRKSHYIHVYILSNVFSTDIKAVRYQTKYRAYVYGFVLRVLCRYKQSKCLIINNSRYSPCISYVTRSAQGCSAFKKHFLKLLKNTKRGLMIVFITFI